MQTAPLYSDVADAPDGGAAHWLTTADGMRIRAALWTGDNAKATILLMPGRTEHIEKYGRAAREFLAAGYATLAVDWRGQGLSDRMHDDRGLGHVMAFGDYQQDVAALLAHARDLKLPEPFYLVAHSMGGCIGLRALNEGLPVRAAMFSAPMWGVTLSATLRPLAWGLSTVAMTLGFADRVVPGQTTDNYLEKTTLAENELTHDPDMFDYMAHQIVTHPDLGLGAASIRWLYEALHEMRGLASKPSPALPALTFLGTKETIVDPARIFARMSAWDKGTLTVIDGGKHEMMMEIPSIRAQVFAETIAFFDAHP